MTESARLAEALAQAVVADDRFAGDDWAALALVIQLDGQESMSGYAYTSSGDWIAAIPASFDVLDRAEALRAAMAAEGRGAWKTCLLQIVRPGKATFAFDDDDVDRWAITPANLLDRVEELRPR